LETNNKTTYLNLFNSNVFIDMNKIKIKAIETLLKTNKKGKKR